MVSEIVDSSRGELVNSFLSTCFVQYPCFDTDRWGSAHCEPQWRDWANKCRKRWPQLRHDLHCTKTQRDWKPGGTSNRVGRNPAKALPSNLFFCDLLQPFSIISCYIHTSLGTLHGPRDEEWWRSCVQCGLHHLTLAGFSEILWCVVSVLSCHFCRGSAREKRTKVIGDPSSWKSCKDMQRWQSGITIHPHRHPTEILQKSHRGLWPSECFASLTKWHVRSAKGRKLRSKCEATGKLWRNRRDTYWSTQLSSFINMFINTVVFFGGSPRRCCRVRWWRLHRPRRPAPRSAASPAGPQQIAWIVTLVKHTIVL